MPTATDNTAFFRARIKALRLQKRKHFNAADGAHKSEDEEHVRLREHRALSNCKAYSVHARDIILRSITELRDLVLDKRKGYILCSGAISTYGHSNFMSDTDRRRFDNDTDTAMRQCAKLIQALEAQINSDETLSEEEQRHLKAVTHLLNVYLKDVCRIVAQLRAIHLKKTQNLQRICRLANLVDMYEANIETIRKEEDAQKSRLSRLQNEIDARNAVYEQEEQRWKSEPGWDDAEESFFDADATEQDLKPDVEVFVKAGVRRRGGPVTSDIRDKFPGFPVASGDETLYESEEPLTTAEEAQLLEENEGLFQRLSHTNSDIQQVEKQLSEIQRLQDTFAEKVLEQERNIDVIHTQTVYTLDNLETANEFIREAIKNGASRRVIALFCLIVLTFTLLFLDWYNP